MTEAPEQLDLVLAALANRHRREMVRTLALHPEAISRLADQRALSLPAINKHVTVLVGAGLVDRRKLGRTTFLALRRGALLALRDWLAEFQLSWGTDADSLENYGTYLSRATNTRREEP